ELQWVITRTRIAEQRIHRHVIGKGSDRGAIFVRCRVKSSRGREPRGCGLVAWNDIRMSRNVLAEVTRKRAEINVIAAARAAADQHIDRPALVEVLDAL